ncbi:MAG: serine/threonine-protein kinase [Acidobacteriota bacterium]
MFHENKQIGNYTLIKKLGRGGFGEVWLAERKSKFVTTKVAVKLPHDEQVDHEAIKQEATLWEQASGHPNILPIIDADEYDGQIVIVSEYAPDGSLEQWLKTHGKMPIEKAVETTIQILDGLEFLHSRNIIHRDLKPANILLQGNTPRLADFGISRALRTTVASQSQNISGTFAYMSPEALDGKRSIQTDIWSVGVNLYQFLTGTLPFPNKEPSVLLVAIMMREYAPLPSEIPQSLQNVIAKALAKLPENRYGSTKEMRGDLQKVLRGEAIPNFIQTDSGETLTVKRSSPQRKIEPTFDQNSQVEKETVVRTAPNSKKSALNMQERLEKLNVELENVSSRHKENSRTSKEWLNILFITVSVPVIILCGLYIFNYLSDTKMNGNSQVSKSGEFNNSNLTILL